MDLKDKRTLRENHVALVEDLEPKYLLEYLLEDGVLTDNDVELISNGKSRRERCQLLLSILPKRGPSAYGSFRKELRTKLLYPDLDEILGSGKSDLENSLQKENNHYNVQTGSKFELSLNKESDVKSVAEVRSVCDKCISFIPQMDEDSEFSKLCRSYCCMLLYNIEPTDILDYHFQEQILGDDDFDRIRGGSTRLERCKIMLQLLAANRNERVVPVFKNSLKRKYAYILNAINKHAAETNQSSSCMHARFLINETLVENHCPLKQSSQNATKTTIERKMKYDQLDGEVHTLSSKLHGGENCLNDRQKGHTHSIMALSSDTVIYENDPNSRRKSRKIQKRTKSDTACRHHHTVIRYQSENKMSNTFTINPGAVAPFSLPPKRLVITFNFLSTMINQGNFKKFESLSSELRRKYYQEPDMQCILGYLHASKDLFRTDFESAKKHIKSSLEIAPKTSNPKYFTSELLKAKTRMHITQKKLKKVQETLDDAKMMIETDPVGYTGRAAGWLYMNAARNITAQIAILNFRKERSFQTYSWLLENAKSMFQKALINFQQDGGNDGPFGFGYSLCRLVILLLRCGDNGLTMGVLSPPKEDMKQASVLLEQLENSQIAVPKILKVHYLLAKSDYQFRRENTIRALEHAQSACDLSTELNMREFTEHARNRLVFLKTKTSLIIEDIDEEETNQIFCGESSDIKSD